MPHEGNQARLCIATHGSSYVLTNRKCLVEISGSHNVARRRFAASRWAPSQSTTIVASQTEWLSPTSAVCTLKTLGTLFVFSSASLVGSLIVRTGTWISYSGKSFEHPVLSIVKIDCRDFNSSTLAQGQNDSRSFCFMSSQLTRCRHQNSFREHHGPKFKY